MITGRLMKNMTLVCVMFGVFVLMICLDTSNYLQARVVCKGKRNGADSQVVCIMKNSVYKVPLGCDGLSWSPLVKCKWRTWKQRYTNNLWEKEYTKSDVVATVLKKEGDVIHMERAYHNETVVPDYEWNLKKLQELDARLERNGHVMLDVKSGSNAFLDDDGRITLIDFNIVPNFLQRAVDKYDQHAHKVLPMRYIYGNKDMRDWVTKPTQSIS